MTMPELSAHIASVLSALADLDRINGALAARRRRKKGRVRRAIVLRSHDIRSRRRAVA